MGITEPDAGEIRGIAVVPPGLEAPAAEELRALGCEAVAELRRAVRFRIDTAGFYRLHLQARLPFRLLRQLAAFPCRGRDELYAGVQQAADWSHWLPPARSFRVDASGTAPGLNHSHYSALQVKNALVDQQRRLWGQRSCVDLDDPDLSLHLHLGGGMASLSLDGSGGSLHRRGYRAAMGLAPLKENLAAGLIALTGWNGTVPLADPLCGSGTLLIEAARLVLGRAPALGPDGVRRFALERWPDFDPQLWDQEVRTAAALARSTLADGQPLAPMVGMEQDPAVLEQARSNATDAGVAPWLDLRLGDFRDFQPPAQPGVLVCNPPYGERIGETAELENLYADLGRMVKERCSGWSLWLLSGNPALTGALRMKASRRIPVSNGGIDCRWLHYTIR
ncbi:MULTISPECIES: THUMP domain-containing class I SAM-dependent RNA methyltransferase [Aphanothece]|uniref:THUMP domain-containing class I SAM-dependent RNA methyltransferase n=1 Tax=Aphanothece TaxID=1121 RepID=UPI003985661C